ncbi:MAG: TPM domain-containing protein [Bacteroidaceae bacterium]|nr:TPM domain-containing protein [Bacteroidaceae bacterium]
MPIPYLKDKSQYVSNPDGILTQMAVDSLNMWLGEMEKAHGVQTILAVVEHIEGGEPYDFCMALGRKYGVGSKEQNTGLIILLSTRDRAYYILTGRGIEGTLPDAICKRIENNQMLPALREGDWDEAMLATVRAITKYVDGDDSLVGKTDFENEVDVAAALIAVLVCLGILGLFLFLVVAYERKKAICPNCHKHTMKFVGGKVTKNRLLGICTHHDTYRCTNCHFEQLRTWDEDINGGIGGAAAGSIFGSSRRGGFSGGFGGGGSFGGSFGGGSFGGGGAGGRF